MNHTLHPAMNSRPQPPPNTASTKGEPPSARDKRPENRVALGGLALDPFEGDRGGFQNVDRLGNGHAVRVRDRAGHGRLQGSRGKGRRAGRRR